VVPDPGQPYTAHARLDTHYLNELTQYILGNPAVREQLRYFPNNTLYQIASEYRYFYFHTDAGARHYAICAIGASPYVRQVLRHARGAGRGAYRPGSNRSRRPGVGAATDRRASAGE
jgi:hypothetical protein